MRGKELLLLHRVSVLVQRYNAVLLHDILPVQRDDQRTKLGSLLLDTLNNVILLIRLAFVRS